ncbi:MAG: hypothetical protein BWX88_01871 [Planctomycetes bacterium ADurb.Bin126]|nr:MAG: hypothetical protein BWX88_01871 [Planctomycetes bacterium ADurb.Bin126]HOD81647.1 hypothetical protein [Phycisphaerae bacterium]HQL74778.1 hypothetical protein [Phycisphaerae bacterium]
MRLGIIIIALAAIAVALVQVRREEMVARHRLQTLRAAQVKIRRALWEQQVRLGELTAPRAVRHRAAEMALGLVDKAEAERKVAVDAPPAPRPANVNPQVPLWQR